MSLRKGRQWVGRQVAKRGGRERERGEKGRKVTTRGVGEREGR